ncbi:MAG TPA: YggS family pyridoxal phosphate-dependent enzyme [Actinomycetes bacterium]|nr:YggS family pyridoxal phosphate-dependent enzyme [Actinomycetes bacterium]
MSSVSPERRREIAEGLDAARSRIAAAEDAAGRPRGSVGLVVVTKTFPAAEVAVLHDLGVRRVGENRDQEASAKAAELADRDLVWHFIGQLQTNKAKSVARYASVVESVDRPKVVAALSRGATAAGRELQCLVQVSLEESGDELDGDAARGGALPDEVPEVAAAIKDAPGLSLGGVMAVAPLGADPGPAFARLAEVATRLQGDHPEASVISAGMSQDLEAAVQHGATHVRLGSAILGYRPPFG